MRGAKTPDSVKFDALLKKVSALANNGIDGEKIAAQSKLNEIAMKYGVDAKDYFNGSDLITREFVVANTDDAMQIMAHCIWDLKPSIEIRSHKRKMFCVIGIKDYILAKEKYKYYWRKYKKLKDELLVSFVIEHGIGIAKPNEPQNN
jgi:hypothetical protein